MAFVPITSWEIEGGTVETVSDYFLGLRITADSDCSHEIKRRFLLGRRGMTNLGSILKSRDITLSTKVHLVKALVFPVIMYECESWTLTKAEHWKIDAFELWCWRRPFDCGVLERPFDYRESQSVHPRQNLSWIFIGRTDAEAETLILWPPNAKNWLIGKDPDAGKDWRREEKGTKRMKSLDGITDTMEMFELALVVGDGQGNLVCCSQWGRKESDNTEWWTELNWYISGASQVAQW